MRRPFSIPHLFVVNLGAAARIRRIISCKQAGSMHMGHHAVNAHAQLLELVVSKSGTQQWIVRRNSARRSTVIGQEGFP